MDSVCRLAGCTDPMQNVLERNRCWSGKVAQTPVFDACDGDDFTFTAYCSMLLVTPRSATADTCLYSHGVSLDGVTSHMTITAFNDTKPSKPPTFTSAI